MLRHRSKGFTLVELMIAITLLMFVMLATIPFIVTSMSVNRSVSLKSRAQMSNAERLSQLQFIPEDLIPLECTDPPEGIYCEDDPQTIKGVTMTRRYKFNTIQTNGINQPSYVITMYITYDEKGQTSERFFIAPWVRK
jgi:prepilin-type N-terminal cleavage/methylation domain-containing protein